MVLLDESGRKIESFRMDSNYKDLVQDHAPDFVPGNPHMQGWLGASSLCIQPSYPAPLSRGTRRAQPYLDLVDPVLSHQLDLGGWGENILPLWRISRVTTFCSQTPMFQ